jgi:glutathione S-transferase
MKLFHSQFSRSGRVRWMLEEIGEPYEMVRVAFSTGAHKQPGYLAINPNGSVPALVDGDLNLIESSAIIMYLADKYPNKQLAPPLGSKARAEYYRWMVYVPATLDPVLEAITMHGRMLPEGKRVAAIANEAKHKWESLVPILESALAKREYIVGDTFTAADVVLGSLAGWVGFLGMLDGTPNLAEYNARLSERPAHQTAYAD